MSRNQQFRADHLARFLRYVLANSPDEFGLLLDPEGWIEIKRLVQALAEEEDWKGTTASRILDLGWQVPDSGLEIEDQRIRYSPTGSEALTPPVRTPMAPPITLYTSCRRRSWPVYREEGIHPSTPLEIILARSKDMALRMGRRKDPKTVVLQVQTRPAEDAGVRFLAYGEHLFVAEFLPAGCLSGPKIRDEDLPVREKKKPSVQRPADRAVDPANPMVVRPWHPDQDRLVRRNPEQTPEERKRLKGRKPLGWKEDARRKGRQINEFESGNDSEPDDE
jgi:putative RNA 2'-phosphotransferase